MNPMKCNSREETDEYKTTSVATLKDQPTTSLFMEQGCQLTSVSQLRSITNSSKSWSEWKTASSWWKNASYAWTLLVTNQTAAWWAASISSTQSASTSGWPTIPAAPCATRHLINENISNLTWKSTKWTLSVLTTNVSIPIILLLDKLIYSKTKNIEEPCFVHYLMNSDNSSRDKTKRRKSPKQTDQMMTRMNQVPAMTSMNVMARGIIESEARVLVILRTML